MKPDWAVKRVREAIRGAKTCADMADRFLEKLRLTRREVLEEAAHRCEEQAEEWLLCMRVASGQHGDDLDTEDGRLAVAAFEAKAQAARKLAAELRIMKGIG